MTDWVFVGDADMSSRQAGWTFRFVQPPEGTTYVMRGVVELQWREQRGGREARTPRRTRKHVARKRQRASRSAHRRRHARRPSGTPSCSERTLLTKTGMKGVQGGDPAGLSKAMCLIW